MPSDLATYVSQLKYYERMHKVKEREQHVQEVSKIIVSFIVTLHCGPALFVSAVLYCSAHQLACVSATLFLAGSTVFAHSCVIFAVADARASHFVLACVEQTRTQPNSGDCWQVLSKFDGSKWVYHITKPCAPKLGQAPKEAIPSLAPRVRLMPGMIAAHHALRAEA